MAVRLLIENRMRTGVSPSIRYNDNFNKEEVMFDLDSRLHLRKRNGLREVMYFHLYKIMNGWTGMHNGRRHSSIATPKILGHESKLHVNYAPMIHTTYFILECNGVKIEQRLSDWQILQRSIT